MGPEVLVVGGGLSGLSCAQALGAAGLEVVVLEARERVGGRLHRVALADGQLLDVGGQWIGPGQPRVAALAARLGLATFATHTAGASLMELAPGDVRRYRGALPPLGPRALADLALARVVLAAQAARVDPGAPWTARGARRLDEQTFATWIRRHLRTARGRAAFALACRAVWSVEPGELSLLHVLAYVRAAGGLDRLLETEGGAQQTRFVGGAAQLADGLAGELGSRVRLGEPVRRLEQTSTRVRAHTDTGAHEARLAVVALPPALAGRLDVRPPLPAARDQLTQRIAMGSAIKVLAVYDRPFWREDGLSGTANSLCSPTQVVFDNTPASGSPGVLLAFLEGQDGRRLGAAAAPVRRAAVLDGLQRLFGPRAAAPEQLIDHDWSAEEFSRGCYAGVFPPGAWTAFGPSLRTPVGRIHWAGTETATRWPGYMEGALQAGRRAADEVVAVLRPPAEGALIPRA